MPAKSNLNDPKNVVLAFAAGYTKWEQDMDAQETLWEQDSDAHQDAFSCRPLKKRYKDLLKTYCTIKKRAYVDEPAGFQDPPVYSDVIEINIANVEGVTRSRMHVDTKYRNGKAYRFVVLKKKDGWRIDSVKWKFRKKADWENTLLGS